jgi:DNA-binding transcriptional LysR family regulator
LNYEQLKTFLSVADKKSFSETARVLHLSQPTVTSQIKSLEKNLNTTLFERTTKQVELTPSAKILYRYAKEIVKLSEIAENEILSISSTIQGRLTIASSLTIGEYILPQALGKFNENYPHIQMNVDITNTHQILSRIKDHVLDIGLIEAPVEDPELVLEPFMEDELVLIAKPGYFEQETPIITLVDLLNLPLILREEGSGTRTVMESHLIHAGLNPADLNLILELGSTESVKSAVESGLGISIISRTALKKELQLKLLKIYPIESMLLNRHFYIVYHRDTVLKPTVMAFLQSIKDLGKQHKSLLQSEN